MHFDLTADQRLAQEMARAFAEKEIKPRAAEIDRTDEFPRDLYQQMGDLGLLGMTVPPEYGGAGADALTWAVVQEELARASAAVADSQLLVKLMTDMLLHNGSEAQRQAYLPALVRGEKVCVIAQHGPGTGYDVAGVVRYERTAGQRWRRHEETRLDTDRE